MKFRISQTTKSAIDTFSPLLVKSFHFPRHLGGNFQRESRRLKVQQNYKKKAIKKTNKQRTRKKRL